MSSIQMGSLRVNNSVTNISRLGTFNKPRATPTTSFRQARVQPKKTKFTDLVKKIMRVG
jgi:hypothetical protein